MSARALLDYLPDFGAAAEAVFPAGIPDMAEQLPFESEPGATQQDIDAIVAAEVAAAEARLRAELEGMQEAALAAQEERHREEMREMQASLGEVAAAGITAAFEQAAERTCEVTASAVARLLSSLLGDDIARRSVEELSARIRQTLAERDAVQVHVSGPQSLLESLGASLGDLAAQCEFSEAEGFDVTVVVDGTLFETRLAEWSALVGEALS